MKIKTINNVQMFYDEERGWLLLHSWIDTGWNERLEWIPARDLSQGDKKYYLRQLANHAAPEDLLGLLEG